MCDKYIQPYKLYTYVFFMRLVTNIYLYKSLLKYVQTQDQIRNFRVLPYYLCPLQYRENHRYNLELVSVPTDVQNDLDHLLQDWVVDLIPCDRNLLAFCPCLRHVVILLLLRFVLLKVLLLLIKLVNPFQIHL